VVTPKNNGDVRFCLDARQVNKAIIREKYPIPTMDALINEMSDAKVFSKIDLKEAYTQIELHEQSRHLTNFVTEHGVYRFTRLIYGINTAGDIFQKCLNSKISDLKGVKCIVDDIIVHGKDENKHKQNLANLFNCLREHGFKVNAPKCIIGKHSVSFFRIIADHGVKPDPEKVKCLANASAPTNKAELQSFLGLCTFLSRFIPCFFRKNHQLEATHQEKRMRSHGVRNKKSTFKP